MEEEAVYQVGRIFSHLSEERQGEIVSNVLAAADKLEEDAMKSLKEKGRSLKENTQNTILIPTVV